MYDQIREDTLYIMLYTVVTTMAMMGLQHLVVVRFLRALELLHGPQVLKRYHRAVFIPVQNCSPLLFQKVLRLLGIAHLMAHLYLGQLYLLL